LNLLVTMALAGIWHGAGWPFVLWGLGHGLWLLIERQVPSAPFLENRFGRILKALLVFHGVCLLWVLFRSPTLAAAGEYFSRLLLLPFNSAKVPSVLAGWLIVFALAQWPLAWTFKERRFQNLSLKTQWLLALICLYFVLAYASARVDFIYFTF
jgi:alginate O-acetyltransferase complex protein AlgI